MLMLMVFTAMSITLSITFSRRGMLAHEVQNPPDRARPHRAAGPPADGIKQPCGESPFEALRRALTMRPGDVLRSWHRQTRGMTENREPSPEQLARVVVVGPDGVAQETDAADASRERPVTEMVEQPAKVMRVGSMIRQLLEEVRAA